MPIGIQLCSVGHNFTLILQQIIYYLIIFLINLFGIHLFPTIIVFVGMLPGFYFIEKAVTSQLNVATIIGFVIMLFATAIELISDVQLYTFRKNNQTPGIIMDKG